MKYNEIEMAVITAFVQDINPAYDVTFNQNYWECDTDYFEISVGTKEYNEDAQMFFEWLCAEIGNKNINWWLISLLHEVGHLETYTEELEQGRDILYGALKLAYIEGKHTPKEFNELYFKIPMEYQATMWGVNYYLENEKKCVELLENIKL